MDDTTGPDDQSTTSVKKHSTSSRTSQRSRSRASTQHSNGGAVNGASSSLGDSQSLDVDEKPADNDAYISNRNDEVTEVVSHFFEVTFVAYL